MEQGIVRNVMAEPVSVMWGGETIYFKAGQKRVFGIDIANALVSECAELILEGSEAMAPDGTEVMEEEIVVEKEIAPKKEKKDKK